MLRRLTTVFAAGSVAAFLLAGTIALAPVVAQAQVVCPRPGGMRYDGNGAAPVVDTQHIFCGEVPAPGQAQGFHSRPAGQNPASITNTGAPQAVAAAPGVYKLSGFTITQGANNGIKNLTTMFPDGCSYANVIAAIQNAYNNPTTQNGNQFTGPSGASCQTTTGASFNIIGFTANGPPFHIRTAYPNY